MADTQTVNAGMGFAGWLTLIFVVAKLTGYVSWSWWLVFSPIIVSTALVLLILALVAAVAVWAALRK